MRLSKITLALLGGTAVLAAGGCAVDGRAGFDARSGSTQYRSAYVAPSQPAPTYYRTLQTANHGRVYMTPEGRALYYYRGDSMNRSRCYGNCARQWPPYLASRDARPHGKWSITNRRDGTQQWAYGGRPTYMWSGDREPGAVTGHGRNDNWWIVQAH